MGNLEISANYNRAKIRAMNFFRVSLFACFLAIATIATFFISTLQAATTEQQAVLAPVMALFDGMAKGDPEIMRKALLTGGKMVLMRDGKPNQMTFDAFVQRLGRPGTTHIAEKIHNPLVRIDHDLAVVWAPFEFLVDGKVDHCGTDLFSLVRTDGKWLIASVADTGRTNCSVK